MIHPLSALLSVLAALALAGLLLWPDRGLLWRGLRALRAGERVQMEDALKHLFDREYKSRQSDLESLSGALGVSGGRAAEVLHRLEEQELVRREGDGYRLTGDGRREALRVVRIHRLWERYLSDETGLDPKSWHQEAEELEHRTTDAEAEALSTRMGHPSFDPHGDPIPTAGGEIPPRRGKPLTQLPEDSVVEIVHVEDEPQAVYDQLLAEGLHPGMRLRLGRMTPRRVRVESESEEHLLAPIVAANLWVVPVPQDEELGGPYERLSALAEGERGRVVAVSPALRPIERRRMLDLGLIPGTEVTVELRSPGGDPTGYRIRGAVIALRREQADQIQIDRVH